MRLRYSATSPYVRKVLMVAIECGLEHTIERLGTDPWSADTDLPTDNPLGKVPCLTLDDGGALFDSPVICEYLDSLHTGRRLFPETGPARWTALRQQAIADGICDAAILRRLERLRPDGERSATWTARQEAAVLRALDALDREVAALSPGPSIGTLATLAALGYIDFRWPESAWRDGRADLAAWFERESGRESFQRTLPPG